MLESTLGWSFIAVSGGNVLLSPKYSIDIKLAFVSWHT